MVSDDMWNRESEREKTRINIKKGFIIQTDNIYMQAIHNFKKCRILVFNDLDIYGSVFVMTSLGISAGRGIKSQPDQLIRLSPTHTVMLHAVHVAILQK